jgi:hypothetical protein
MIQWLGESRHWEVPACAGVPRFVMALTERWVLETATLATPGRRLGLRAALNCTSRLALRVALAATNLNPRWSPLEWHGPSVAKAPASAANLGVRFLPHNEYIGYLQAVAPDLARFGVVEDYIDGPQYELDGYVVGGEAGWFHPLLQHWNEAGDAILGYERKEPSVGGIREAALAAVRAIGLDDSPFCVEMRYDPRHEAWRVIELHARLGEDPGLAALMADEYPLNVIERACLATR